MVVVMAAEAGETEVDGVVDRVRAAGGDAFVSRGMSQEDTMSPAEVQAMWEAAKAAGKPAEEESRV